MNRASLIVLAGLCMSVTVANAQTPTGAEDDFEKRVIETIIANPEVVLVALQLIEAKKLEEQKASKSVAIETYRDELFPEGSSTRIVEFIDYNCGYCAASARDIKSLPLDASDQIAFVEYPILGEQSWQIAKVALAVRNVAGKTAYRDFHFAVFEHKDKVRDLRSAIALAESLGHGAEAIKLASESAGIAQELQNNREMGQRLGISGTPSFVTKVQVREGIMTLTELKQITLSEGAIQ